MSGVEGKGQSRHWADVTARVYKREFYTDENR